MSMQTIDIAADTLDLARREAYSKRPAARHLYHETIVSSGDTKTVRAHGETADSAAASARRSIPAGAQIIRDRTEPSAEKVVRATAASPEEAAVLVKSMYGPDA